MFNVLKVYYHYVLLLGIFASQNLSNPKSTEGIQEIEELLEIVSLGSNSDQIQTNFTIVRGLAYYDGFCVETDLGFKAKNAKGTEVNIGSVCSARPTRSSRNLL